jgi:hypothetical protein
MTTANSTWQPLKSGLILKSGAIIQTAAGSYVDLALNNANAVANPVRATPIDVGYSAPKAEQDAIRIFENTVLGVDKLVINETGAETVTETQLDLKAGKIFGTVKKLSASSKYEVKIPNGVAGIRGTIYTLSADGVLTVLSGSVVLAFVGPDGSVVTQVINAGQQFDARTGQITPIPTGTLGDLVKDAAALHMLNTQPTSFTSDERVYYVSPVHGRHQGPPFQPPGPPE